jgi:predicted enzyme related to lactoylglutathione lyase
MGIRNAIATVAVKDLKAAAPWYERLIGRGPDRLETDGVMEWFFEQGGRLQLRQDAAHAGRGWLVLAVGDLDMETRHLDKFGIEIGAVNRTSTERVFTIQDPDGNVIALEEMLTPAPHDAVPATARGEVAHAPHPLERALESIVADTRLSPRTVRTFLDSLILDLEALLRASDESMTGSDPGLSAQLLQRAHIVRGKVPSAPSVSGNGAPADRAD